jgi:chloride channel 2
MLIGVLFFSRFIYPGLVTLVISSLTFPLGLGQFFAGEVRKDNVVE